MLLGEVSLDLVDSQSESYIEYILSENFQDCLATHVSCIEQMVTCVANTFDKIKR